VLVKEYVQAAEGALKVLLVRPKFSSIVANLEPLGLEYISGLLNDVGFENEIFDEFQHPRQFRFSRLARRIKRGSFDCVGFHANANTTDYIVRTSARLKQRFPNLHIMVGGPEAELNYRDFFTDSIDFVYHDNGLTSLKNAFESRFTPGILAEQDGVCFKREGTWVVKEKGKPACGFLTQPDRSSLYANIRKNFIFRKGSFAIHKASFSCPFACSFCYCTKMNSGVYTTRDVSEVIDEVEAIDHPRIWFVDDSFFIDKNRVEAFCNEIIRRKIDRHFMAYSRADFLAKNADILPLAYEAGFRDILVGLEAVDDDLLDEYNKKTTKDMNVQAIKNLRENNIVCNALFVVSHTSTKKDFKTLLRFIRENGLLWVVFGIFTPYKGTDAYDAYKDRLVRFRSKRLDGIHITIKPEHMSSFMFMLRVYWLHVRTYPKIIMRTLMRTGYDTQKTGWF